MSVHQPKKRRGGVVSVDLIDKAIMSWIDDCFATQESSEENGTAGTINSCQSRDNAACGYYKILGLTQNFAGFMLRFSRAFFCNPISIVLRVNARAASKQNSRTSKSFEKIARTLQINAPVKIDIATARTCAMNHGIESSFLRAHLIRLRNIDRANRIR